MLAVRLAFDVRIDIPTGIFKSKDVATIVDLWL
jgi:hypothetical protein